MTLRMFMTITTAFETIWAAIRRFFARLQEKMPDKRELMKLESLFVKAAKAANSGNVAHSNVTQYGLKGHHGKGIAKKEIRGIVNLKVKQPNGLAKRIDKLAICGCYRATDEQVR